MIYAFVAVVLWAQSLQAPAHANVLSSLFKESPGDDIEALCSLDPVNLTTFSQLQTLGQRVGGNSGCSDALKVAIPELVQLIEQGKTDLCSASSIDNLQNYYTKYLDTSNKKKHVELLPRSLRRFVLAYGLQTSNLCKRNMGKVLTEQSPELLDVNDQELLEKLTGDKGPVAQVLGVMSGGSPDEIFMPGDLAPLLKRHGIQMKELGSDKLYLQTATGPYIRRLQSICERRYKPVYEPLMLPLVRLANMGFNYRDLPLKEYLDSPKIMLQVGSWSRIVFLCEALASIEIVREQAEEKTGLKPVRILTKEEAAAIKQAAKAAASSDDGDGGEEEEEDDDEDEQEEEVANLVYVPSERVQLGDLIYDQANKILCRLIRKFKTNWSTNKIIRRRVAKKGLALARDQLKKGQFRVVLSAAYKGIMRRKDIVTNPSELLVKSLDEMIQRNGTAATDTQMGSVDGAILDALLFILGIAMTFALVSSFFVGLLL